MAAEIGWRFPTDKITVQQWTQFREEVLAKPNSVRAEYANQLVVTVEAEGAIYVFTQPQHPAYPAVVVRAVAESGGGAAVKRMGHFAGSESAFATWWHQFDALDATIPGQRKTSPASAAAVSVRQVQPNRYEFVLTNPIPLSEKDAQALIATSATSICKDLTPVLGKYRFEANERIGGGAASDEPYRFVQEVSCAPGATAEVSERRPMLQSAEEARQVQEEIRLKSEAYIRLIAAGRIDEAYAQVSAAGTGVDEATWKSGKRSFQETAGEPLRISIVKITVYDNPAEAPEPGLYVAADFGNEFRNIPIHCGYLMWFRPFGGNFRITREETGFVTAEQLKSIPGAQLPEIKQRLRCVVP
jgi:Protein of unknown function (DUF4019)